MKPLWPGVKGAVFLLQLCKSIGLILLSLPLKEAIFSIEPPFSKFVKLSDKSFQEGDLEIILGMSVLVPASK